MPRDEAASRNVTDLRRARQRSRRVVRDIEGVIIDFLQGEGIQIWQQETATPRDRARRLNEQITRLASRELQSKLVQWLEERHRTTMARAARASMQRMQRVLPRDIDESDLIGSSNITHQDRALNAELKNIDAGLLYQNSDSLANEIGDRATRQIRIGFSQDEPITSHRDDVSTISQRVEEVLLEGDTDTREEHGITGMTAKSKAELISHDSVQDAYVTAAHRRYLNNGFRYATYDAVIDQITSQVCRRLNEVIIDLVEQPWLLPPNHPWCFPPDTEVLTDKGFKQFPDLDGTEQVFTLDEGRNIHLETPTDYIKRPYQGDLVHILSNDFDVMATPNHEMAYYSDWKHKNHETPVLERKRIDELSTGDRIPRTGDWQGAEPGGITIRGEKYDPGTFMSFLGWYLSEGSAFIDQGTHRLTITQHDEGVLDLIERLARDLFGNAVWRGEVKVGITTHPMAEYLLELGHSHEKHIPDRFKQLAPKHLRACLDAFLQGDGCKRAGGADIWDYDFEDERVYYTSSERLADDLGELILKCGNRPSFYTPDRLDRTVSHDNGDYTTQHEAICVRECRNDNYAHFQDRVEQVPYQGYVYCVSMPENPTIYIRRNGKCTWAGNCRSDLRPLLQLPEGEEPIKEDDIGDDHLKRIWGTNGFRPKVLDPDQEFNPTALNQRLERTGV